MPAFYYVEFELIELTCVTSFLVSPERYLLVTQVAPDNDVEVYIEDFPE